MTQDTPSSSFESSTNRRRLYPRPPVTKIAPRSTLSEGTSTTELPSSGPSASSSGGNVGGDASQQSGRNFTGRRRKPRVESGSAAAADVRTNGAPASVSVPAPKDPRRKANFGATLTKQDEVEPPNSSTKQAVKRSDKGKQRLPQGEDLTSTLIRELSTPPFPDCPICFSSIRPEQPIWSCSPSSPIVVSSEAQIREYCWTSFHLKCIRSWAEKSVKEVADAWHARGELSKNGDWRCPGCQAKREITPSSYW